MPFITEYCGISFVEGEFEGAKILCEFNVDTKGHLKNLRDVKDLFVKEAKLIGANAVVNFTYGQKIKWLARDNVIFYGEGKLAIIEK